MVSPSLRYPERRGPGVDVVIADDTAVSAACGVHQIEGIPERMFSRRAPDSALEA